MHYIYIYMSMHGNINGCSYIYIYIERERDHIWISKNGYHMISHVDIITDTLEPEKHISIKNTSLSLYIYIYIMLYRNCPKA